MKSFARRLSKSKKRSIGPDWTDKSVPLVQTHHESEIEEIKIDEQPNRLNADDTERTVDSGHRAPSPRPPRKSVTIAVNLSFFINVLLLASKAVAFAMTFSCAVVAALVDSVLDLLSQFIIFITERKVNATKKSDKYPVYIIAAHPILYHLSEGMSYVYIHYHYISGGQNKIRTGWHSHCISANGHAICLCDS